MVFVLAPYLSEHYNSITMTTRLGITPRFSLSGQAGDECGDRYRDRNARVDLKFESYSPSSEIVLLTATVISPR